MKSLMKIIAVILIVPIAFIVCLSAFASNANNGLDPFMANLIREQLAEEDCAVLSNADKYEPELADMQILGYPILKVYTEVFWEKADLSIDELVNYAERYSNEVGFRDYIVFSEDPFRLRVISDGEDIHIGKVDERRNTTPTYVLDLMNTSGMIIFQNNEYRIKGIRCFDALSSHQGAVVYFDTDNGVLVKYYENSDSKSILFNEADFCEKATAYYDYITSPQYNYNEDGEPLGGSMLSFAAFLKNEKNTSDDSVRDKSNVKNVLIYCSVFALLISVSVLLVSRYKSHQAE